MTKVRVSRACVGNGRVRISNRIKIFRQNGHGLAVVLDRSQALAIVFKDGQGHLKDDLGTVVKETVDDIDCTVERDDTEHKKNSE